MSFVFATPYELSEAPPDDLGARSGFTYLSSSDSPNGPVQSVLAIPDTGRTIYGNNSVLIDLLTKLYVPDGSVVRDVTWGKGAFWKGTDTSRFDLQGSDVADHIGGHDGVVRADFRALPDEDGSVDLVVLDPPYIHNPGKHVTDSRYNNAATTGGMSHADIRELYRAGMAEALRVLRPGGQLWVKTKDEIESGRQCWSHIEIHADAVDLGYYARDLFVLVPPSKSPQSRWSTQKHARKVHSYLWVFDKPKKRSRRAA
ncbi:Methylase of polypeptide chain release factors [Mycobacteroides abscessus subsp. massiliense]|uniref:class I SAM-dependent methyltransferase n=1 Tax=Mycobacteroides abscessus TaxID=36809 RepID=UPI0009C63793|nr:class I SAM-dependent methyltransferase [Mycobacteroides abscessus]SLI45343.1 Methylase of polypeptide chain release factors [Mycobacteroides abscessus subsp. massiliense]